MNKTPRSKPKMLKAKKPTAKVVSTKATDEKPVTQAKPLPPERQAVRDAMIQKTITDLRATHDRDLHIEIKKSDHEGPPFDLEHRESGPEFWSRAVQTTGCSTAETMTQTVNFLMWALPRRGDVMTANAAVQWMNGLKPQNTLESMLCQQMVSVHMLANNFIERATQEKQPLESVERHIGQANKMLGLFLRQTETLQRLRQGGKQQIIVQHQHQHVNVSDGGQAVIGNVTANQGQYEPQGEGGRGE